MIERPDLVKVAELKASCLPAALSEVKVTAPPPVNDVYALYFKAYVNEFSGMKIIFSIEHHGNGLTWCHVSVSTPERYPTWDEIKWVKDMFLGDVWAYQVLPPAENFINISENCFHLWHCPDKDLMCETKKGEKYKSYGG